MGIRDWNPVDPVDEAFPPLYPNSTGAASANDEAQNHPHRLHADRLAGPHIILRPRDPAPASSDPMLAAFECLEDSINRLQQNIRAIAAPWIVQPPDSESFHLASGIAIPAQDGLFHTVVQIQVPPGRNGVLNKIANVFVGGGFNDYSGNIIWQIVRNPGPGITTAERNYENIQASLGSTAIPGKIAGIRIFENDTIALVVKNVNIAVAGQIIGGLLGGWFYPRTWDDVHENGRRA
jgi:hypothetical protein